MPAKETATELAKSKTAWGGVLQWLCSVLLTLAATGKAHTFFWGIDDVEMGTVSLAPLFLALSSAGLGLVLYGRHDARRKILAALGTLVCAGLQGQPLESGPGAVLPVSLQVKRLAADKVAQEEQKPCDPPSSPA